MVSKFLSKIFGSRNERLLKRFQKIVDGISAQEADFGKCSDEELQAKTPEFRARLAKGETLIALLPEAFAVVREAGKRALGMRHFDCQLVGAMVLNDGRISEMRTGEGKTLVATLASYLNALPGKGVHVITVNDYLARRDAEWMGKLYGFLGMTTGIVVSDLSPAERKQAYACDITYGTNNEFGFDYLRDNMAFSVEEKVQRGLQYAIVDEVDSILIDEARTPLIISGPTDDSSELYLKMNEVIPYLTQQEEEGDVKAGIDGSPGDYFVDEKAKSAYLTEEGHQRVEGLLMERGLLSENESLYDSANIILMHHLNAALRAYVLFQKDVDYIVENNPALDRQEIVIVDEFTGRKMRGRRWSEGLHQAVEAKEGVTIQNENQTLASITFQNYFRMYEKLSGMTGTADTEAAEFHQIYGLEVVVIPTNQEMVRKDHGDHIYLSSEEKFKAIIDDVRDCEKRGQPALVGTASIEASEYLSNLLRKEKIKHEVLNAKQHEREAQIVAQAGRPGAITIATNMAGRGTDIVLGGNLDAELAAEGPDFDKQAEQALREDWQKRQQKVLDSGGLHIVGTERHESRRIDNQLRGRSGRQGDPGSSRFYLSLQDNLMRIFASERIAGIMQKIGLEKGEAIEHPWVTKAIENAQRKVEGRNFDMRKQLLDYDDVANDQRKVVYTQRNELMATDNISENIIGIRGDVMAQVIDQYIEPESLEEQWDVAGLSKALEEEFGLEFPLQGWLDKDDSLHEDSLRKRILEETIVAYQAKEQAVGAEVVRHFEKTVMLQVLDNYWKDHLAAMDYLRQGIHLRGFAQKNPKQEYKREAFEMFSRMLDSIKQEVIRVVSNVSVRAEEDVLAIEQQRQAAEHVQYQHAAASVLLGDEPAEPQAEADHTPYVREGRKVGRNEPCPCGSGKKFKQCHGKLD